MIKTYKYRLSGRRVKKNLLAQAYSCNQVWNWCVAQHLDALARYRSGAPKRKWLTSFDLAKQCRGVGKELGIRQQTVQNVCEQWAYCRSTRFRSSFGAKRASGWIPFQKQSRRIDGNSVTYLGKKYYFFGYARRPLPENVKGGAFVEDTLGRWFVCFHVEVEQSNRAKFNEVGIDLGLKSLAVLSTGEKTNNPRYYQKYSKWLISAQRSKNKRRLRAIHIKIANSRKDFQHKLSTRLSREYALIAVGNVNPKTLAKTKMAKSIFDAGWSSFRNMLRYKASKFIEVDEKFTTQTCSHCGALPPERPRGIAGLGIREWKCSSCGISHDRDVNAAKNILKLGLSVQPLVEESRMAA